MLDRLARVAALAWAAGLALLLADRRRVPDAADEPPALGGPLVSAIVPARHEERGIGAAVRSLRAQDHGGLEVIVVDDESEDGTRAEAVRAAEGDPRVRVLRGAPVPPGWVGKSWACWQGFEASAGRWLLFTDADVVHRPDALGRSLALAERLGRGGLTLIPRVETRTAVERVVLPTALALIETYVAPGPLVRSRRSGVALAAGPYILVRRDVYERAGGHRAIADRMVDDVSLARAVKAAGGLIVPALGIRLVSFRMYHGARDLWRGWSKNASFGAGPSGITGLAGALALATGALAPPAAAITGLVRRRPRTMAWGLAGWAAQAALHRAEARAVPTPRAYAALAPLGAVVIAAAAARGAVDRITGRGAIWRGRRYPEAR